MQHDLATDTTMTSHDSPHDPSHDSPHDPTSDPGRQLDDPGDRRPGRRRLRWILIGLAGAVVLFFGAIFLYAKVLNDSPDELGAGDLDAALDASGDATGASGPVWQATAESQLGYRVKEVLFGVDTEAVGRTDEITGTLTIDGTTLTEAAFDVDVASIESDDGRRDNQFRGRIMSADEFPTASFVLTEPIELGTEPVEGATVAARATGELTLRGVTNPVTFDLDAEVRNGRIGVLGSIPVVFSDYSIANPSFGGITTEDHGLVEFVLVFEPAS